VDGTLGGREIGVDEVERLSLHLGLGLQKVGNPFRTAKCAYKEPPPCGFLGSSYQGWLLGFWGGAYNLGQFLPDHKDLGMPEATDADRKRQLQEVNIFHDVAKALTSMLDLDSILQTIMEKMAEYFRPDTWSLLMVDEERQELYFAIAVGDAAEALKNVRLKVGEGIAGWVAKHGEQLIVPDVCTDARFAKRIDEMTKWETRSIICVPLRSKHRVLGVIQLVNVRMENFTDQEMFFLHSLCDYASIAIENARAVEKIQELTITDDCTGLYNARHLYKILETEVYRSARFKYEFTVLFIDLDHFKQVNDTHGHLIGSKLLADIGYVIKAQLRLIDYAFRYGGDEFVVLLPQTGKDSALIVAKRLRDILRNSTFCKEEGLNLNVRASIGLATYPHDAKTPHDIIRQADEMMYLVKNTTRDNIGVAQQGVMK
jgi:diguanylate cyclase (GGDEF)-like protein